MPWPTLGWRKVEVWNAIEHLLHKEWISSRLQSWTLRAETPQRLQPRSMLSWILRDISAICRSVSHPSQPCYAYMCGLLVWLGSRLDNIFWTRNLQLYTSCALCMMMVYQHHLHPLTHSPCYNMITNFSKWLVQLIANLRSAWQQKPGLGIGYPGLICRNWK